ncbi:hypothetical protein C5614_22025 [Massilia phosphatilytica]|jgi:transposase|nr:hypothetical protein C5614_22025 [Massilia phosphatilytica]
MAKALVPDELWSLIAAHLPVHPPSTKGGRPRISDRATLTGILFVLRTGMPWEYLPRELGSGSGMTCWRRLHGRRQVYGRVFTMRYCGGFVNTTRSRGIERALKRPAYLRREAVSIQDGTQLIGGSSAANTTS